MKATVYTPVTDLEQVKGIPVKNVFVRNPNGQVLGIKRNGKGGYFDRLTGTGNPVKSLAQELSKYRGVMEIDIPDNGSITIIYANKMRLTGKFVPTGKTIKDYKNGGMKPERKVVIEGIENSHVTPKVKKIDSKKAIVDAFNNETDYSTKLLLGMTIMNKKP